MITDLALFVQSLWGKYHEIIVCIASNETLMSCKSGIA